MAGANPQHLCMSPEHYTPAVLVDPFRAAVGTIDIDPASCEVANRVVRATTYYSLRERGEDGLVLPWRGAVAVNPPGERTGRLVKRFWATAVAHARAGNPVLWIGFSVEQLGSLAMQGVSPLEFVVVVSDRRVAYDAPAIAGESVPLWTSCRAKADAEAAVIYPNDRRAAAALVERRYPELVAEAWAGPIDRVATAQPPHRSFVALLGADDAVETAFLDAWTLPATVVSGGRRLAA